MTQTLRSSLMGFLLLVGCSATGCVTPTVQKRQTERVTPVKPYRTTYARRNRRPYRYKRRSTRYKRKSSRFVWPHQNGESRDQQWAGRYEAKGPYVPRQVTPKTRRPKVAVGYETIPEMFRRYGSYTLKYGDYYRQRAQYLHEECNKPGASSKTCGMYKRSQRLFSINYRASKSRYRGYFTFHRRRKWRIPRPLMRWYKKHWKEKIREPHGRCFLDKGFVSNCMSFALCAQKEALANFHGKWGNGFHTPTWGVVNYWSTQAFYRLHRSYRSQGSRRLGVVQLLKQFPKWNKEKQKRVARRALTDLRYEYNKIVRRKGNGYWSRILYEKTFCTNIVVGMNTYKRAMPGDMFTQASLYKRGRRITMGFNHWGLITDSMAGRVLHNQTPGGMWNRHFERWGIQYGMLPAHKLEGRWKYKRRRRRFQKKMFFVNRLNVHYYQYARQKGANIYDTRNRSLCRDYIRDHADVYFRSMLPQGALNQPNPSPYVSLLQNPQRLIFE